MTVYALWSSPRSRSTAFFRSMVERGDLTAVHEPFFNVSRHGRTEIGDSTVSTVESLLGELRDRNRHSNVFFKETTDHRFEAVLADTRFLAEVRHTFLIRRPEEIAASYHALYPAMKQHDIGLETLHELHAAVCAADGHPPVVIDSDDLVDQPSETMAAYCRAVDLPFLPRALTWAPADRPEWQRTAEWHRRTAASTGFERNQRHYPLAADAAARLMAWADHHRPFYERLRALRLDVRPSTTQ